MHHLNEQNIDKIQTSILHQTIQSMETLLQSEEITQSMGLLSDESGFTQCGVPMYACKREIRQAERHNKLC